MPKLCLHPASAWRLVQVFDYCLVLTLQLLFSLVSSFLLPLSLATHVPLKILQYQS